MKQIVAGWAALMAWALVTRDVGLFTALLWAGAALIVVGEVRRERRRA